LRRGEDKMVAEKDNRIKLIVIIVIGAVLVLSFLKYNVSANEEQSINVIGKADVDIVPDVISVDFVVETEGETSREAKDKNSNIVDVIKYNLDRYGIDRNSVHTQDFQVYEEQVKSVNYDEYYVTSYTGEKVYKVKHKIRVVIEEDDSNLIGLVVDVAIDAGAQLEGVNFELSSQKESKYKAEAIKLASENARMQAEAMADGLGMRLGKVVSINNQNLNGQYQTQRVYSAPYGAAMDKSEAVAVVNKVITDIQPSEKKISATMSVTYSIRQSLF